MALPGAAVLQAAEEIPERKGKGRKEKTTLVHAPETAVGAFASSWFSNVLLYAVTSEPERTEGDPAYDVVFDGGCGDEESRSLNGSRPAVSQSGAYLNVLAGCVPLPAGEGRAGGRGWTSVRNAARLWTVSALGWAVGVRRSIWYAFVLPSPSGEALSRVLEEVGEGGRVEVEVGAVFGTEEWRRAEEVLRKGEGGGVVVVKVR